MNEFFDASSVGCHGSSQRDEPGSVSRNDSLAGHVARHGRLSGNNSGSDDSFSQLRELVVKWLQLKLLRTGWPPGRFRPRGLPQTRTCAH